jgi:hypothetical protein
VPIDTDNGKLALLRLSQPWLPSLPFGDEGDPDTLDQADKQQLLWGFPEILWGEVVVVPPPNRVVFPGDVCTRKVFVMPLELPDVRVGDVGTELVVAFADEDGVAIDLSDAGVLRVFLRKPGRAGTVLTKTAELDTDGADGLAKYATAAGDLDTPGEWRIQGYAEVGGNTWRTVETPFPVRRNLA